MSDTSKGKTPHDGYLREHPRNQRLRLEVRSADDDTRTLRGIASTGQVDRMGDILDPDGGTWKTPIPLLNNHDYQQVIGTVTALKRTAEGISFSARVAKIDEPPTLAARIDEVWSLVKHRLIRTVSIGFRPTKWRPRPGKDGGLIFEAFEVLELSLVPVPANPSALIEEVAEAASFKPAVLSEIDAEIEAVLASGRSTAARSYSGRVVRLDGAPSRSKQIVRLTAADWQRARKL